jgi:myo-inositol-1(or 4)-monophosphatase
VATDPSRKINPVMDLLEFAQRAATLAAAYLRTAVPPSPEAWTAKGQNDFVTEVDRQAEKIIRGSLLIDTPNARVIGEELGSEIVTEGLVWIVDPLDGTTNFLHRYPSCSVSIAAAVDGRLEAGVVLRLVPDWCYSASRGQGAWHGNTRLEVSKVSQAGHALIGTGFPFKNPEKLPEYQRQFAKVLPATSGVRRAGSAALDLADVAAGRFDGFWELALAPWDVAAGMLLVREAGGLVTDLLGHERQIDHGPVVAGNPAIHDWLIGSLAI